MISDFEMLRMLLSVLAAVFGFFLIATQSPLIAIGLAGVFWYHYERRHREYLEEGPT